MHGDYTMDPYYKGFFFFFFFIKYFYITKGNIFFLFLIGGHTIGTSACQFFQYRMYNFTKVRNAAVDPSINSAFLPQLQALCPQYGDGSKRVALDTHSPNRFDTSYFRNMRIGQGILESDQMLWNDASTKAIVQHLLLGLNFKVEFGNSMVKMSNIGVKIGNAGEIRQVCSKIN